MPFGKPLWWIEIHFFALIDICQSEMEWDYERCLENSHATAGSMYCSTGGSTLAR